VELRHLRYFVAVAEELNFGRAARRLHMTQPPLSLQVRQLEEELGCTLLNRTKRSVELTEIGAIFLEQARRIVADADAALRLVRRVQRGEVGELVIGFSADVSYESLPQILLRYRAQFPDVSLQLHEMPTSQQVIALRGGQIDLGMLHPPIDTDEIDLQVFRSEPLVVALPQGHRLLGQERITLRDLNGERVVRFARLLSPGHQDAIWSAVMNAGVKIEVVQEANQSLTLISLVAAGIGITLLPASVRVIQRLGVHYRELSGPTPVHETAIAWRRSNDREVLRTMIDLVVALRDLEPPVKAPVPIRARPQRIARAQ
jgi:DNA-binding transcriptional LysR family regulator